MTTAGGNQAGRREKAPSRQNRSPGRGVLAIVALIGRDVFRLQAARLHVRQNPRPELHAVAQGKRVRIWRTLFRTRQHVQSAQHDLASAAAIPLRQLECPPRERQMHRDPNDLGHGRKGRPSVQQVFVPIADLPVFGCGRREAGQSEGRGEHVLAEAGVWILRIERIDQERIARPHRARRNCSIQKWRPSHFGRAPSAGLRHHQLLYMQSMPCQGSLLEQTKDGDGVGAPYDHSSISDGGSDVFVSGAE